MEVMDLALLGSGMEQHQPAQVSILIFVINPRMKTSS